MALITNLDELAARYDGANLNSLRTVFAPDTDHGPLVNAIQQIMEDGNDADVCVEETPGKERWILNVRTNGGPTPPEQHHDWHDCSIYLLGRNAIRVGGALTGADEVADGEWRGGTLIEERTYSVRAGELLWVPANIPHANAFGPGTAFVIVKLHRSARPMFTLPAAILRAQSPTVTPAFVPPSA